MSDRSNAPTRPEPLSASQVREWLDFEGEALLKRRSEVIAALRAVAEAHPKIDDDEVLGSAAENIKMAGALTRTAEDRRVDGKAPFLEAGREVDAWFRRFREPLERAVTGLKTIMDDYGHRKLVEQRRLAEAERKRAEQAEAEALAAAQRDLQQGRDADAALERASLAAAQAEQATTWASARAPDLTRTRGDFGAVASAREKWSREIENFDLIPRQHLMVNPDSVKEAGRSRDSNGRPIAVIPGIRWVSTVSVGVR